MTYGDWLAFMDDGGYRRPELWLSAGWATAQAERWEAPLYWERADDGWTEFTLGGSRPVTGAISAAANVRYGMSFVFPATMTREPSSLHCGLCPTICRSLISGRVVAGTVDRLVVAPPLPHLGHVRGQEKFRGLDELIAAGRVIAQDNRYRLQA